MLKRAEKLLKKRSIQNYQKLRDFFIRRLKNKFPFGNNLNQEASLSDIKDFFALYDSLAGAPDKVFVKLNGRKSYQDTWKWVEDMRKLRALFQSFLEQKTKTPEIQIEWEFRANTEQERQGDNVIDFTLKPHDGEELVFVKKDKNYSKWTFGDRIEVGFKWIDCQGQKTPYPALDPLQPALKIYGKKASFVYESSWSLFALLYFHRVQNEILKFDVPQGNGTNFIGYNRIRFVQDGLAPKDPKQYLELGDIPMDAPEIEEREGDYD